MLSRLRIPCSLLRLLGFGVSTVLASQGAVVDCITVRTAVLQGQSQAPFALDFQLNDGSGLGGANNQAVLSGFQFGLGGSPIGNGSRLGGVIGTVDSTVTLQDSLFRNEWIQPFVAGDEITFTLTLSTNLDAGGTPDQFSLAVLDRTGVEIPTTGLSVVGSDALLSINIDSSTPTVQTFGADPSRTSLLLAAPNAEPCPEPRWMFGPAALLILGFVKRSSWITVRVPQKACGRPR